MVKYITKHFSCTFALIPLFLGKWTFLSTEHSAILMAVGIGGGPTYITSIQSLMHDTTGAGLPSEFFPDSIFPRVIICHPTPETTGVMSYVKPECPIPSEKNRQCSAGSTPRATVQQPFLNSWLEVPSAVPGDFALHAPGPADSLPNAGYPSRATSRSGWTAFPTASHSLCTPQ